MNDKLNLTLALIAGLLGGVASRYLNGPERVRLGAPLPDPMIHGVRHKRSGPISGLLISDGNGNERGGYLTRDKSGEAFFTLDSEDEQQVLFLANPKGGVHLNLFDSKGNEADLSVFRDGPRLFWNCQSSRPPLAPLGLPEPETCV